MRFTLAKAYEGTDLSAGTVYSLWSIPGGQGDMTELATSVDGDNLLIDWPLKEGVVSRKGMVEFQIVVLIDRLMILLLVSIINSHLTLRLCLRGFRPSTAVISV